MKPQRINYLGPRMEITVGDNVIAGGVVSLDVWSTRVSAGDSCRVVLAEPHGVTLPAMTKGDPLEIAWGYAGYDLDVIFKGTVDDVSRDGQVLLKGIDAASTLLRTRITKTYVRQTAAAIVKDLAGGIGLDTSGVADASDVLDRLPLFEQTVVEALRIIGRRLGLDHELWVDTDGLCHWKTRSYDQEPVAGYTHGVDILDFERAASRATLLTTGCALPHSVVVEVNGTEGGPAAWFVESVHHFRRPGKGSRTEFTLEACP